MDNATLLKKAGDLCDSAKNIKHPMLPAAVKTAIVTAAMIIGELVSREVERNGE